MQSLVSRILNNPGLTALATPEELFEIEVVVAPHVRASTVILRRTINQKDLKGGFIKFWRVMGPAGHRNLGSELSVMGLQQWGII